MKWREYSEWSESADRWVADGNVAIAGGIIERVGGGESRYLQTRDPATFRAACEVLGTTPPDVPRRSGVNIDGVYLLKALYLCRYGTLDDTYGVSRPWDRPCPECGLPFDHIAAHDGLGLVQRTIAACAAGHQWTV
jgi:hypothetical protein